MSHGGGVLDIVAEATASRGTYLSRCRQRYPLHITRPLYLDRRLRGMAFLYMQNPAGGIFSDDDLRIDLDARATSQVHLTTQSATKVYRTGDGESRQSLTVDVGAGSFVEVAPDPIIAHAGARLWQSTTLRVEDTGIALLMERVTPGRAPFDDPFSYGRLCLTTRVECGGRELVVDTVELEPARLDPRRPGVLGHRAHLGSLFAIAPCRDAGELMRALLPLAADEHETVCSVSSLPSDVGVLVRVLGTTGAATQRILDGLWSKARTVLTGAPAPRRPK